MKYTGRKLKEICFPIGGIGTGSIGITGNGVLTDWEIMNRPSKGKLNGYSHFAVTAETDGKRYCKILNGDNEKEYSGQYVSYGINQYYGFGFGMKGGYMSSFPHFKKVEFNGEFPIATLKFKDDNFPGKITLTAFNPFIPLDSFNSSLPVAFFKLKFTNDTDKKIKYRGVFAVSNPFGLSENKKTTVKGNPAVILKHATAKEDEISFGDMTAVCVNGTGSQAYWYRGNWQDFIVTYYNELESGVFTDRNYAEYGSGDTCTLYGDVELNSGESKDLLFVLTWSVPNAYNYWSPCKDENGKDITWKNYYATMFENSTVTAEYCLNNYNKLYKKTKLFKDALHSQTLDKSVIDAVSSTLSVLNSSTVLRLSDGEFYGWEGVGETAGSCEGTCQHVWNYAYALCFLFPDLERSIRKVETTYCLDKDGKTTFRVTLPLGREKWDKRACLDGQTGTVIKFYREWKLSGDDKWLKDNWENIKLILSYAWSKDNPDKWDLNKDGVLEGRQHHTLDMELFGPSGWLQGFYLTALKAGAEMAEYLGDIKAHDEYTAIFNKGKKWTEENLFNGEYLIQKIDLTDKSVLDEFDCPEYFNTEKNQIKYQIAEGSEIDQLCGLWHAGILGLGEILDKEIVKKTAYSIYKYNFKPSLREFPNPWRVFALNDEGGAVMCDYPKGKVKPAIPINYCEECMTGFEYQLAGTLILNGYLSEGLSVVRAIRNRYDGEKRNPFNEIECGSNYARAMASFALIPIYSGFYFDMPNFTIGFNPAIKGDFCSLFSVGSGWGIFEVKNGVCKITLKDGNLSLKSLKVGKIKSLIINGKDVDFIFDGEFARFEKTDGIKEIVYF